MKELTQQYRHSALEHLINQIFPALHGMIDIVMSAPSPHPRNSRRSDSRRAPQWVAPVLAAALAAGTTWGVGMTVFKGALVEAGQPEEVAHSSADQKAQWVLGAELSRLHARAQALAQLSGDQREAKALTALEQTLSQGASLLGQLSYDNEPAVQMPSEATPAAVAELAVDVAELSHDLPVQATGNLDQGKEFAQIAFQMNFDARRLLAHTDKKQSASLPQPLHGSADSQTASDDGSDAVSCLGDPEQLTRTPEDMNAASGESIALSRALDRGYALDYVLQLEAARGPKSSAASIEQERKTLNSQLDRLRSTLGNDCADLRQPAYQMPKDSMDNLDALSSEARNDFSAALVTASGNADGQAQSVISSVAFDVLKSMESSNKPQAILKIDATS